MFRLEPTDTHPINANLNGVMNKMLLISTTTNTVIHTKGPLTLEPGRPTATAEATHSEAPQHPATQFGLPERLRKRIRGRAIEKFIQKYANQAPPLPQEQQELLTRISLGDRSARTEMTMRNARLAIWIAKRFWKRGLDFEDLLAAALTGLIRAIDGFDVGIGTQFSTYAVKAIYRACEFACRIEARGLHLPEGPDRRQWEFERARDRDDLVELDWQGNWGLEELIQLESIRKLRQPLAMQEIEDADMPSAQSPDTGAAMSSGEITEIIERMRTIVLSRRDGARDWQVVERRFGLKTGSAATLDEIGRTLGLTRERVRQIETECIQLVQRTMIGGQQLVTRACSIPVRGKPGLVAIIAKDRTSGNTTPPDRLPRITRGIASPDLLLHRLCA